MTLKITTTKAPVGPPTWVREPPKADMRKPAITAVTSPLSGDAPLAIASAMDKGSATTATVRPASASARRLSSLYRSEEHKSELQSLMRISYAVFCLQQNKHTHTRPPQNY